MSSGRVHTVVAYGCCATTTDQHGDGVGGGGMEKSLVARSDTAIERGGDNS